MSWLFIIKCLIKSHGKIQYACYQFIVIFTGNYIDIHCKLSNLQIKGFYHILIKK
jgi:hypothetical protein